MSDDIGVLWALQRDDTREYLGRNGWTLINEEICAMTWLELSTAIHEHADKKSALRVDVYEYALARRKVQVKQEGDIADTLRSITTNVCSFHAESRARDAAFAVLVALAKELWETTPTGEAIADPVEQNGTTYWVRFAAAGKSRTDASMSRWRKGDPHAEVWDERGPSMGVFSSKEVSPELRETLGLGTRILDAWNAWDEIRVRATEQREQIMDAFVAFLDGEVRR